MVGTAQMSAVVTDACGKLKTAFLFHLRRDSTSCRELLDELFPPPGQHAPQEPDVDAPLDRTVLAVATETLDDMPAGDPRYALLPLSMCNMVTLPSVSNGMAEWTRTDLVTY